jgi:hypothetical protein
MKTKFKTPCTHPVLGPTYIYDKAIVNMGEGERFIKLRNEFNSMIIDHCMTYYMENINGTKTLMFGPKEQERFSENWHIVSALTRADAFEYAIRLIKDMNNGK